MEYVVIKSFTDKETQEHYAVGDKYPRCGSADDNRIAELSTVNNRRGVILIEAKVEKPVKKVKTETETKVEETTEEVVEAPAEVKEKPEKKTRKKK